MLLKFSYDKMHKVEVIVYVPYFPSNSYLKDNKLFTVDKMKDWNNKF